MLASPDDPSTIRGRVEHIPRTNVILEWGYLTAILGRERVALCKYDGVYLPTDLAALTHCPMGIFDKNNPITPINSVATSKIVEWAKSLGGVAALSPVAMAVHGYSTVWSMRITYTMWRGLSLSGDDYVYFEGRLHLLLPPQGAGGVGATYGKVYISVGGCNAVFRLTDIDSSARVFSDGTLSLISESFTRQLHEVIRGTPPQEDGFVDELPDPNRFETHLIPDMDGRLIGELVTIRGNQLRSKGEVICERVVALS
jgi:hypothetical protein